MMSDLSTLQSPSPQPGRSSTVGGILRAVLVSYTHRPLIWLLILVYGAWCGFSILDVMFVRSGMTRLIPSIQQVGPLASSAGTSQFVFDGDNNWDRLTLFKDSADHWSVEQLRNADIPKTVTRLDMSRLLGSPAERSQICGQTDWPEDDSPAGQKLLTFFEDVFQQLSQFPRLTHVALPPLRLTSRFADLLTKLPPVDTLVLTGTACLPESWPKLATIKGVRQMELIDSIVQPGLSALSEVKTLRVLTLYRCQERDGSLFPELDKLPQLTELRIGVLRLFDRPSEMDVVSAYPSSIASGEYLGLDPVLFPKLRKLSTKATIRLLPDSRSQYSLVAIETMRHQLGADPRFRLGFVSPYVAPGFGNTFVAGGILMLFLNLQLFGQLSVPQAWLSTKMAWGQVLFAAMIWAFHTVGMVVYGQWWGTDGWAIVAVQLLMPALWGSIQLVTYQTERLGQAFCATLWGGMCGLSGMFIQGPIFFFHWVPYLPDFAAGELPGLTNVLLAISAACGVVVLWQLPKLPRLVEEAGIGDFPLGISFIKLSRYQQQRRALAASDFWQPQLLSMTNRLNLLSPGTFWSLPSARIHNWSAPIPFRWPIGLLACLMAPIVGCLAIAIVQVVMNGRLEIPANLFWPMFVFVLLQTPPIIFLMIGVQWLERTRMMTWEVTRPLSRRDLDRTYASSVALEVGPFAVWHLGSLLLVWLVNMAIRRDHPDFSAESVIGLGSAGLLGWLIAWACLLAVIATGSWWQRFVLGLLGFASVIGLVLAVALNLANGPSRLYLSLSPYFWAIIVCVGLSVAIFFRSVAARQWKTREFSDG